MELKKYKLGEVCTIIPGYAFKSSDFGCGKNWVIKIKDIAPPAINIATADKVAVTPSNKYKLSKGDYVMAMTGATIGKVGMLQTNISNVFINQRVCKFVPNEHICDKTYLYYVLSTQSFKNFIFNNIDSKLAQPNIGHPTIYKYSHLFPNCIKEQKLIASVLHNLDCKIALNHAINDNLEAMAKQLYDYWFVQFDFPNEEGKPYKSSGGAMVWNEKLKREIPKGWSGVSLKDLALTSRNAITPVENEVYQHFSIPSFDAYGSYSLDNGSDIKSDKFVLQEGQLLVSKLNPWFNRVVWVPKGTNMIGSTEFVVLNPNNESESGYIYSVIKSPKFIAYCSQAATGTSHSQRRVSPDILMAFKVVYEQGVVQKYGCLIEKIQKQQAELLSEIAMLTKQRDELLPLLMNGQASINSD